eukprot:411542-Rhodomonas_salina.2
MNGLCLQSARCREKKRVKLRLRPRLRLPQSQPQSLHAPVVLPWVRAWVSKLGPGFKFPSDALRRVVTVVADSEH